MKKNILSICFIFNLLPTHAQNFRFEFGTMYGLSIEEFKDSTKISYSSNHGGIYFCKDHLVNVVRCLLGGDYGRVKIKGTPPPNKYIHLELYETSEVGLNDLLASGNKKVNRNELDSLSLVKLAIGLLGRKYKFIVSTVIDTEEVWILKVTNPAKLVRFNRSLYLEDRGSGLDSLDISLWQAVGQTLDDICMNVRRRSKVVVYDETNETGLFDFEKPMVPYKTMENFETINSFLETYYGLHFVKRKQLEKLKIIEFK